MTGRAAFGLLAVAALVVTYVLWLVLHSQPPADVAVTPPAVTVTATLSPEPTWAPTLVVAAANASPRATGTATATQEPAVIDMRSTPTATVTPMPPLVLFDDPTATPTSTPLPVQKG